MVGDIGVEVNGDGNGGLNLHMWKCPSEPPWNPTSPVNIHFDSEDMFMEFCIKLLKENSGLYSVQNPKEP
jgi:hypothetical protein